MMQISWPVLDVLSHRGIEDAEEFFQNPTWQDMPSPSTLPGVSEVVSRIRDAIRSQDRIAVYGDYDCDGALSTAILQATLNKLGTRPAVYLPHRDEGYGFTEEAVHRFSCSGTDLVITIDNGINAAGPVRLARRLGMDVVVIDHHQIETRADAIALWSDRFCATGLGLMVSWAILEAEGFTGQELETFLASLSRLAAIASIADCVPLVGATRTLTKIGLAELSQTRHAGLRKLLDLSGVLSGKTPSSEQIAFRIAPRINAAGRVGHPAEVLRMLSAATSEDQIELALMLDRLNRSRRLLEKEALEELLSMVQEDVPA